MNDFFNLPHWVIAIVFVVLAVLIAIPAVTS
jgi:hypothetical protein